MKLLTKPILDQLPLTVVVALAQEALAQEALAQALVTLAQETLAQETLVLVTLVLEIQKMQQQPLVPLRMPRSAHNSDPTHLAASVPC
jgi:hypothetical protein